MRLTPSQQDALNIEKHVCVTAGAGSGKTTILVERYLKILREANVTPREIVAITFTEKAAAEMKERIIKELSAQETRDGIEQNDSLQHFREEMGSAHISTIHAFCSRILREFPFQAGVPANFSIIQGIDQKLLLQKTLKETLRDIATNPDDPHRAELTRLLQRYGGQQKLVDFFSSMINQRDVVAQLMREVYDNRSDTEIREHWQQSAIKKLISALDVAEFIRCLKVVLVIAKAKRSESVKDLTQRLEVLSAQNPNSLEVLNVLKEIAYLIVTGGNKIAKRDFIGLSVETISVETEIGLLISAAKKIKNSPALNVDDDFLISTTRDLFILYDRIFNEYQTVKLSQGILDFADLQIKTRDLLRKNEEVRKELIGRHRYYMVDEYQDTNELQHELIMLFTNCLKNANLFIVGDPKQSIYAFRGADVRVFEKAKEKIVDERGQDVSLTENFRSLRNTIGLVNYFFNRLMGDGTQTEFEVPYEALTQARPIEAEGAVDILIGKQGDESVNESELIARHIKNMRANEETVSVRGENGVEAERPIAYGDIAILIRNRRHLPDIEHALLESGIPYLTTGGIGFYQRQEIYDIWNYLNFLNAPTEKHASLVGVLRGPAFGISDTELYEISLQAGKNFWEKTQKYKACSNNLSRAITTLKKHIQISHRMFVNQLILTIVNETGMIGTLKTGKYGQQRWANYQKLLEIARNFDGDENTRILPDFIEFLDILITEEPLEGEAPVEASDGAVQIMTVHAAKGLQFPVVMLPCLDRRGRSDSEPFIDEELGIGFSPLEPDNGYKKTDPKIVDLMKSQANAKGTAERKRLLYVGATRAQDRLILSGTLSEAEKPQQMLEWLYENLDIGGEDLALNLGVKQNAFANGITSHQSFQLQIPISRTLVDFVPMDENADETAPVEFPECLPLELEPTGISTSFSVSELANYGRCPLRYQLENVLRIPPINGDADTDVDERELTIRRVLARIRLPSDAESLDTLIEQVSENYPEIADEPKTMLRGHVNNFLNSTLGETAFGASKTFINQQIHADIEEHVIDGRFDRLFKDETDDWQIINYKTDGIQNLDAYLPELELYSLLLHRRYPNQSTVTINLFFTQNGQWEQVHFSTVQLQELQERWKEKILELQRGICVKNLNHCCSCPYADTDGECIITES